MLELTSENLYAKFLSISQHYAARNAVLDELDQFFGGDQWEDDTSMDEELELCRTTWNYARMAVMRHVALMVHTPPRVDVAGDGEDRSARARETFLRAAFSADHLWRPWGQGVELNASKLSYGVLKAEWIPKRELDTKQVEATAGKNAPESAARSITVIREMPLKFTNVPPKNFYPIYADTDYNDANDILFCFREIPDQMVAYLELKFGKSLQPTAQKVVGIMETCKVVEYWDAENYCIFAVTRLIKENDKNESTPVFLVEPTAHKYGRVPFFVLQNIPDANKNPTEDGSISDVELIREPNKHMNLMNTIIATSIYVNAMPPMVYKSDTGHEYMDRIRGGAGEVIPLGTDEELEFKTWQGQPEIVTRHLKDTVKSMEDLGNLSYSSLAGDQPASGVGQQLNYANTELTLALKTNPRVSTLQEVGRFLLHMADEYLADNDRINFSQLDRMKSAESPAFLEVNLWRKDVQGATTCFVSYGDVMPRDKTKIEQHIAYLYAQGVISLRTALEHVSYVPDPAAEMNQIRTEIKDLELDPQKHALYLQAKQMGQQKPPSSPTPTPSTFDNQRRAAGVKFDAAPPVPSTPEMPTSTNAPGLARSVSPNLNQMFPQRPGVYQGPPVEETM